MANTILIVFSSLLFCRIGLIPTNEAAPFRQLFKTITMEFTTTSVDFKSSIAFKDSHSMRPSVRSFVNHWIVRPSVRPFARQSIRILASPLDRSHSHTFRTMEDVARKPLTHPSAPTLNINKTVFMLSFLLLLSTASWLASMSSYSSFSSSHSHSHLQRHHHHHRHSHRHREEEQWTLKRWFYLSPRPLLSSLQFVFNLMVYYFMGTSLSIAAYCHETSTCSIILLLILLLLTPTPIQIEQYILLSLSSYRIHVCVPKPLCMGFLINIVVIVNMISFHYIDNTNNNNSNNKFHNDMNEIL